MDNLLKILPLMNMPEAIRQPLLLDALAGKGNAVIGFIAARQASDAASAIIEDRAAAQRAKPTNLQAVKDDAEAILAHLYRQKSTTYEEWATRLAALRAAIKASQDDDDQAHFRDFAKATGSESESFLIEVLHQGASISPAILRDLQSVAAQMTQLVDLLALRHKSSVEGLRVPAEKIVIELSLSPIAKREAKKRVAAAQLAKEGGRSASPPTPVRRKDPN